MTFEKYAQLSAKFLENCEKIIAIGQTYLEDISLFNKTGIFPVDKFADTPVDIPKISKTAPKAFAALISALDAIYSAVLSAGKSADKAMQLLDDYGIHSTLTRVASQTRLQVINQYRGNASKLHREMPEVRQELINLAVEILPKHKDLPAYLIAKKTPFCLAIYVNRRADFTEKQQSAMAGVVEERIKELFPETPMPPLTRKYIPITKSMPWEKLMTMDGAPASPDAEGGVGVVAIKYSTPTVVEFDVECLINPSQEIIGNAGLSEKTIARYSTTRQLTGGTVPYSMNVRGSPPYVVVESVSPDLWRMLSPAGEIPRTSSRPQDYHKLHSTSVFRPTHKAILQRLAERPVISGEAAYDLLAGTLVEKFRLNPPTTREEYLACSYDISDAVYQHFPHTHMLNLRRESMVSYLLRLEPTIRELIVPEIMRAVAKFAPSEDDFKALPADALGKKMLGLYEQALEFAMKTAKEAKWLDDYDQTYKICYLHYA
jgi:hypothetical protein